MFVNVRIRSVVGLGEIYASWAVRPEEEEARMPRIKREFEEISQEEPGMEWRLETRGEWADWHELNQ